MTDELYSCVSSSTASFLMAKWYTFSRHEQALIHGHRAKAQIHRIHYSATIQNGLECALRCSLAPTEPLGFWGLTATAKSVRAEMQDLFLEQCVFSIQPSDVVGWLRWLEQHAPKQLSSITKVTLVGLDQRSHAPSSETLRALEDMLPNLNGVGYQCQTPRYSPVATKAGSGDAELGLGRWWSNWGPVVSLENFAPRVTVVVEGMLLLEVCWRKSTSRTQTAT
jgi:hypothetical protein